MIDSLRTRLLLWHAGILVLVLSVAGLGVCYASWRSQLAAIDAALTFRAGTLERALQPLPAGVFDLVLPPVPPDTALTALPDHVLWAPNGTIIDRSDPDLPLSPPEGEGVRTRAGRREVTVRAPSGVLVRTGLDLADARREVASLAAVMAAIGAAAIGLSLSGGWWLVSRALAPVDRMGRTAHAMVEGDFHARIAIDRIETEFGQLARALNNAFDRWHASLESQRRFTADASHELRTPLATASTEVQWALARERTSDEYRRSLAVVSRAADRMQAVVERLLALARIDAAVDRDGDRPVVVADLAHAVIEDLASLAGHRRVSFRLTTMPVVVQGDAARLADALTNVVVNAVQYGPPGGIVTVAVEADADAATVTVRDHGPGIAPSDVPRVFEPFFRSDEARNRDAGGAGLGLTLTRAIVQRHGGSIAISSDAAAGTAVTIRLPRSG